MVKEGIHGVLEVWLGESRLIQFIWGEMVVLNWPGNCLLWTSLPLVKSCYNLCLPQFRIGFLIWILDLKFVIFDHVGLFSLCKLCSYLAAITFVNWISFFFHVVSCLIEVGFFVHVFICLVCNGFVTICFLDRILRQLTWHFNLLHSPPSHDVNHFIHYVKNALFSMFMNSFWGFLIPLNHCYSG